MTVKTIDQGILMNNLSLKRKIEKYFKTKKIIHQKVSKNLKRWTEILKENDLLENKFLNHSKKIKNFSEQKEFLTLCTKLEKIIKIREKHQTSFNRKINSNIDTVRQLESEIQKILEGEKQK
jgi:hypothetical protein